MDEIYSIRLSKDGFLSIIQNNRILFSIDLQRIPLDDGLLRDVIAAVIDGIIAYVQTAIGGGNKR